MYLKKLKHFLKLKSFFLGILLLSFYVVVVDAALNTWTFSSSTAGDYTYDTSLVAVDNSGAGPIPGVNKVINPSFESNITSWTYLANTALTASGGLITDATRTTNTDGDGATPPAGYGIWVAATNLITNGGFETNTVDWAVRNGTESLVRSTARSKFGVASGAVTTTGACTTEGIFKSYTGAASTTYSGSFWAWVPTGMNIRIYLYDNVSGFQGGTTLTGNNNWQRATMTAVTGVGPATYRLYARCETPGAIGTFYIDGAQVEQRAISTPYVETNGSTASRTAGDIQIPSGIFNTTQGWITFRTRLGWGSTTEPYGGALQAYLFDWRDSSTSVIALRYREATNDFAFTRRNNTTGEASSSITLTRGDLITVTAAWTATDIKISLNGAAFSSSADSSIPTLVTSYVNLGTQNGTFQIDSDILWWAAGAGTLTDADAATINSFGNTPPETSGFPESSIVSGLWPAVTSAWTSGSLYRNTTTKYLSSAASAKLYASQTSNFTQNINVGNTDTYTFDAYAYTDGSAVTSSDLSLYYNGSTISTTFTSMGGGWYKLTGSLTGANASRSYGLQILSGKTVYLDDLTLYRTGNYTVFNTTAFNEPSVVSWDSFSQSITANNNSNVTYQICLDDSSSCSYSTGSRWQYYTGGVWTNAVDASSNYSNTAAQLTSGAMTALPVTNHKISVKSIFSFGGIYSPLLSSLSIGYSTPTPTEIPSSGGGGSSSSSNDNSSPQTCSQAPPLQAPNLYAAVPQNGNSTLLYFTNGQTPLDHYSLEFGTSSGNYQYGADNIGGSTSRTYLVSFLSPNTTYYFRVRGGNGCAPGPWSNEISSKTLGLVSINNLAITNTSLSSNPNNSSSQQVASLHPTVTKKPTPTPTKKVKANFTPTKATTPTPTIEAVRSTPSIAQDATSSADLENQDGYNVSINVKNEDGEPIEGAEVTVHSKVQTGRTDKNGVIRFTNVEKGEHRVLIAYNGFNGEQSVNLTGDVKEFSLNVTVRPSIFSISPLAIIIILVLLIVIIAMAVLLKRKGGPPIGKSFRFFSRKMTSVNAQSGS